MVTRIEEGPQVELDATCTVLAEVFGLAGFDVLAAADAGKRVSIWTPENRPKYDRSKLRYSDRRGMADCWRADPACDARRQQADDRSASCTSMG